VADTTNAPLPPVRDELLPIPQFGGNSDIGIELGVGLSFARFREGYRPYALRLEGVGQASFKIEDGRFRILQQYYAAHVDVPQVASSRARLDLRFDFTRNISAAWFGIGNATKELPLPAPPGTSSAYNFVAQHARLSTLVRVKTDSPFEIALLANTRYEFPDVAPGSKIAEDLASGAVIGGKAALLQSVACGFIVDTRDNEFNPRSGIFYQVGVAGTIGSQEDVRYGEVSAVLAHYAPLGGPFTFASRMVGSALFGNIPFYELEQGGVFEPQYLLGSSNGVRGVRLGRYAGRVKVVNNNEIRVAPFPRFRVLRWRLLVGVDAFFDAGRVWADYVAPAPADGTTLGLKWGAGGGFYFQWDEAALFRIDVAYSPESSRGFPLSYYFGSGFLF
jgi:hypothetical protein